MPEEPCSPRTLSILQALIRRLLLALAAFASPSQGVAHGFGVPYRLPAPLPFFLAGVALAVILTFAVVVLHANKPGRADASPNLPRLRLGRLTSSRPLTLLLEIISVALFLIVIVAGIFGSNDPLRNVAPHLVLVAWWLGVAYLSAFLGNVWPLLDPWRILFDWFQSLAKRVDDEAELSLNLRYPHWLGVWPAGVLFMTFSWFYVASPDPSRPSNIAAAVLIYSVITWLGMVVFGKERWLRQGEAFTVAFGLLARFAPTEIRPKPAPDEDPDNRAHGKGTAEQDLVLRPLVAGLAETPAVSISVAVFVILFLATVLFDAFTATPAWVSIVVSYYETFGRLTGATTIGLVLFTFICLVLFLLASGLATLAAGRTRPLSSVAKAFALPLVPVLLSFHLGHYLSHLLAQGQLLIPLASDPFGFGWDLFGTVGYQVDLDRIGSGFAWYLALMSVAAGHALAAWLSFEAALQLFGRRRRAVTSQLPFVVLLLVSAVVGLWILGQPLLAIPPAP